jgi:hypothetical protein
VDTEALVEPAIDDGEKLLVELSRDGFGVAGAAWLKSVAGEVWFLYIGSPLVSSMGIKDAYGKLINCLQRHEKSWVQVSDLALYPSSDPLILDIVAFRDRYPGERVPTRRGPCRFGGMSFGDGYIYPRITSGLTHDEVVQAVTGLMGRAGVVRPSNVTLRDGTAIRGIPCGLDIGRNVGHPALLQVNILDEADGSIRTVPVAEVANIQ